MNLLNNLSNLLLISKQLQQTIFREVLIQMNILIWNKELPISPQNPKRIEEFRKKK